MPRLRMPLVMAREVFGKRDFPREPEPDLVMDGQEQVEAYAYAGRIDGVMSAAYLYHSACISQVIRGCKRVIDVGCGPATQLAQVAQLNPDTSFLGVDLSSEMLAKAREYVDGLGLTNVEFLQADMTDMHAIADDSADGVISTMALHHLPTEDHLVACLREIRRMLKTGGALYLVDFGRMKSLSSVIYFAYMNAEHQPHIFSLDYERSLRAAFLKEDFVRLAAEHLGDDYRVDSTAPIPILVLVHSQAVDGLPVDLRQRIQRMRAELPSRYRKDIDLIRRLFRFGGFKVDPFA